MAETRLTEQVAVVTGASHGIGAAIARRLAEMGAHVVLAARSQPPLQALAEDLSRAGLQATACVTDVRLPEHISALIHSTVQRHGRLDILVNNAGVGAFDRPLHETPLETWDAIMETNLRAVYLAIAAVAPHMIERRSGHIVNISSLAGHNPVANGAAYAASKWGLNGLTYSVAEELRGFGIRVSVVCPGSVNTDLVPGQRKDRTKMLQPEDVAHVVAMLVTQGPQSFASEVLLRPTARP